MLNYEVTFIADPVLSGDEIKKTVQSYSDLITGEGCKVTHSDALGLKQLAYPINKKNSGIYHCIQFETESGTIVPLMELAFRRDERIMRFLTVRLDKHGLKYNDDKRAGKIGKSKKTVEREEEKKKEQRKETQVPKNADKPIKLPPGMTKAAPKAEAAPVAKLAETPVVEKEVVAPVVEEKVEPAVEKVAAPVVEEKAAPVVEAEKEATPVVEEKAAPVVEAEKEATPVVEEKAAPVVEAEKAAPVEEASKVAAAASTVTAAAVESTTSTSTSEKIIVKATGDAVDLTKIEGIGPKAAEALVAAGIVSYTHLKFKSADDIKGILTKASSSFGHMDPTTWATQAEYAANGEWDALKKWQDEHIGGKSS